MLHENDFGRIKHKFALKPPRDNLALGHGIIYRFSIIAGCAELKIVKVKVKPRAKCWLIVCIVELCNKRMPEGFLRRATMALIGAIAKALAQEIQRLCTHIWEHFNK